MTTSTLLERTHALYIQRPKSLTPQHVAKETGLSVSWLQDFQWLRSKHPSVTKIETLYVYLSGKPLDLEA